MAKRRKADPESLYATRTAQLIAWDVATWLERGGGAAAIPKAHAAAVTTILYRVAFAEPKVLASILKQDSSGDWPKRSGALLRNCVSAAAMGKEERAEIGRVLELEGSRVDELLAEGRVLMTERERRVRARKAEREE